MTNVKYSHLIYIFLFIAMHSFSVSAENLTLKKHQALFNKCSQSDLGFKWKKRKINMFATNISMPMETVVYSNCIELNNIKSIFLKSEYKIEISVNSKPFTSSAVRVVNKDKIVIRTKTRHVLSDNRAVLLNVYNDNKGVIANKSGVISWTTQTTNSDRKSKTWLVGPKQKYTQINQFLSQIQEGDEILLEGDHIYDPIHVRNKSGSKERPIKIIGLPINNKRPIIRGNNKTRYKWALSLINSHYWQLDNLILENGDICYRHQSAFITITNTLIQNCGNGILGTDQGSGSLSLQNLELRNSGGKPPQKNWAHALYFATDRDRFPHSNLTITKSFIHSNKGNSLKSRAEELYLYGNWIENSGNKQSIYALELIGFDGFETTSPIHHDVVGNVISINNDQYGVRVGGDGTGVSDGITNISENVFLINTSKFEGYLFRLAGKLSKLSIQNNIFLSPKSANEPINFIRDYITSSDWSSKKPDITVKNNITSFSFLPYFTPNGKVINKFSGQYENINLTKNSIVNYNFNRTNDNKLQQKK